MLHFAALPSVGSRHRATLAALVIRRLRYSYQRDVFRVILFVSTGVVTAVLNVSKARESVSFFLLLLVVLVVVVVVLLLLLVVVVIAVAVVVTVFRFFNRPPRGGGSFSSAS